MGSGKTTVGKLMAERLGWRFLDTDEQIEKITQKSICELFLLWGEETFRIIERDVVWAASQLDRTVISIGGGALLNPDNVADLKAKGFLIWLKACPHTILRRIPDSSSRPLLRQSASLHHLLKQRRAAYSVCQATLHTDGLTAREVVERILNGNLA